MGDLGSQRAFKIGRCLSAEVFGYMDGPFDIKPLQKCILGGGLMSQCLKNGLHGKMCGERGNSVNITVTMLPVIVIRIHEV